VAWIDEIRHPKRFGACIGITLVGEPFFDLATFCFGIRRSFDLATVGHGDSSFKR
jgi:hypothetical protein